MDEKVEVVNVEEFDEVEVHENCTVQILRNSRTGETSIGWWEGGLEDEPVWSPHGLLS